MLCFPLAVWQVQRQAALLVFLGSSVFTLACTPTLNPTRVSLRNCVEQEQTADGRMSCLERVPKPKGEPDACVETRTYGSKVSHQPVDEDRLEDLRGDVKYLRHEAWEAVADAPFAYEVDWGGSMVGAGSHNAKEWFRGALLGHGADIRLGVGPDTRSLLGMSIKPNGEVIEDFVEAAPADTIAEASSGVGKVAEHLDDLHAQVHEIFSGLYMGLDKLQASKACYVEFAEAERRMQRDIAAFEENVDASHRRLEQRREVKAKEEAAQRKADRTAWGEANVDACRAPEKSTDCDGIDAYLAAFPQGEHVDEAKQILESVMPTLGPMRDEAAWKAADAPRCRSPKSSGDCDGVQAYVKEYPQGRHADEARRLLRLKRAVLARLAALEEQRRRIAALRAKQQCVQDCARKLRQCQRACPADPAEAASCRKDCRKQHREACVPACNE